MKILDSTVLSKRSLIELRGGSWPIRQTRESPYSSPDLARSRLTCGRVDTGRKFRAENGDGRLAGYEAEGGGLCKDLPPSPARQRSRVQSAYTFPPRSYWTGGQSPWEMRLQASYIATVSKERARHIACVVRAKMRTLPSAGRNGVRAPDQVSRLTEE